MAIHAGLTLLCLGFLTGFFLVLSFLEKPMLPIMTAPHALREHESDVRWTHSQMQNFVRFIGINGLSPIMLIAFAGAVYQVMATSMDVIAICIAAGTGVLLVLTCFQNGPAMRKVRDTPAYEADLDTVSSTLFRMVRLHHGMFLVVIPLLLAQMFLLFI